MSPTLRQSCAVAIALLVGGAQCATEASPDGGGAPGYDATLIDAGSPRDGATGDAATDAGITNLPLFWQAYCGLLERCQQAWGRQFADATACASALHAAFLAGAVPEMRRYDEVAGESCRAALQNATCDPFVASPVAACPAAFAGDKAPLGESCEQLLCGRGLYCDRDQDPGSCPVCALPGGDGASCSETPLHPCDGEHFCDLQRRCSLKKASGIGCSDDGECASGFCRAGTCSDALARNASCGATDRCAHHLVCRNGSCTDLGGTGDPCAGHADCMPLTHACRGGACQPYQVGAPGAPGATCGNLATCASGSYCDLTGAACSAFVALGGNCGQSDACGPDAHCDHDGLCAAFAPISAPCSDAICAAGSYCTTDTDPVCMPTKIDGAHCAGDWECQSTACDDASGVCAAPPVCIKP